MVLGSQKNDEFCHILSHLDLQRHVWVVAEDRFYIGAKHSGQLVECVHLARVYDQVVPGKDILISTSS